VAAIAAVTGKLVAPHKFGIACPKIEEPDTYLIDDSMFIFPTEEMRNTPILRGPNIGEPPRNEMMPPTLSGQVVGKVGDKITTDHILPAGARLKYRSNIPAYAKFVFENVDPTFSERCLENKTMGVHNIIVAGESYGQGSSREHAAMCPMYLGVKAVIAKSFERIHSSNLINFGILPLVFEHPDDYGKLGKGDLLVAENWRERVSAGMPVLIANRTGGGSIECTYSLSEKQKATVLAGGLLNKITQK